MDRTELLDDIMRCFNIETKVELAKKLDITPQQLQFWYTKKNFDFQLLKQKFPTLSGEWLLTGNGPMLINDDYTEVRHFTSEHAMLNRLEAELKFERERNQQLSLQLKKTIDLLHTLVLETCK